MGAVRVAVHAAHGDARTGTLCRDRYQRLRGAIYGGGSVVELVLMDMTGRTVATFVETEVADITRLPTGAYIVRIRIAADDREEMFYKKIVKK